MRSAAVLICAALLGLGCASEDTDDLDTGAAGSEGTDTADEEPEDDASTGALDPFIPGRDCDESLGITWESFGQGFILSQCAGCHSSNVPEDMRAGAPAGVDFETHELTQQWLERIYARSADEANTMPPVDSIPEEDRIRLGDWLACGAP